MKARDLVALWTTSMTVLSCSAGPAAGGGVAPPRERVEIGYAALRISLPIFVAEEHGIFARHGLDVTLKRYETAQPLVEEALDGRIVAGGYAALPILFTAASRGTARLRLVTLMVEDAEHPVTYLLKRRGDASLTRVADLGGKRVGILPTTAYRHWLDALLVHAGVDPTTVRAVPLAPAQEAAALAGGGVDALLTNDPMATAALASGVAEQLGESAPVPAALGGRVLFGAFVLSPPFVAEHPTATAAIVASLDEAIAAIEHDQASARRAMIPYARESERGFVDRYPPARYLPSRSVDDAVLAAEVDAELRLGLLDARVDVHGWALSAAAPVR